MKDGPRIACDAEAAAKPGFVMHGTMSDTSPPPYCRLLVCIGPCCDAQGRGSALLAALSEALAGTEGVACLARACLRVCTRDTIVRIEPSGEIFANPDVEELVRIAIGPEAAR
jgi:hypothetical protein